MSDDATPNTAPTDEPKAPAPAGAPAPQADVPVPEAEATVERLTTEPEPEPPHDRPPPEFAEVAAATGAPAEPQGEAPAPEEPKSEELVPVEPHAGEATAAESELPTEPAWERVAEAHAEAPAEAPPEHPAEHPAEQPAEAAAEAPPAPAEEAPAPKPKRPRATKKKAAAPAEEAAVATVEPAEGAEAAPAEPAETAEGAEAAAEPKPESNKKWYAVKVQSGREDSIRAAIERKVKIEGLEPYFGRIVIPVEEVIEKQQVKVKDKKTGEISYQERKVTRKRKKYHGYIFAEVEFNDAILFLFRETSGVGDFVGIRPGPKGTVPRPDPMPDHEVQAMLTGVVTKGAQKPGGKIKVKVDFEKGDRVRIREGPFSNSEGEVKSITEPKDPTDTPKVTVVVTLWGRPVDVDLDYWQVEKV